jgi:hypothetical protein
MYSVHHQKYSYQHQVAVCSSADTGKGQMVTLLTVTAALAVRYYTALVHTTCNHYCLLCVRAQNVYVPVDSSALRASASAKLSLCVKYFNSI